MKFRFKTLFSAGMSILLLLSAASGCRYVPDTEPVHRIERRPRSEYTQD